MIEETLNEYRTITGNGIHEARAMFNLTTKYLDFIKEQGYQADSAPLLGGLVDKIITINNALGLSPEFSASIERSLADLTKTININPAASVAHFNNLYTEIMRFYNRSQILSEETVGLGPFKPENSDRKTIVHLITDAIEIIRNSTLLKEKAKESLIQKLSEVIVELNNPKTNWGVYFKQIGYVITFLGTVGGIAGGVESMKNLLESKEKLEEANRTVEKTSITISQLDINDVFHIEGNQMINTSEIIQIEKK